MRADDAIRQKTTLLDARSIPLIIFLGGRAARQNGGPRKCSGLEEVRHSRARRRVLTFFLNHGVAPHAVSPHVRSTSSFFLSFSLSLGRSVDSTGTRDLGHSRTTEKLWNRTLVTRTVTPVVDPPARLAAVEHRTRKPAPQKTIATSLARSPRTSSNYTICI